MLWLKSSCLIDFEDLILIAVNPIFIAYYPFLLEVRLKIRFSSSSSRKEETFQQKARSS